MLHTRDDNEKSKSPRVRGRPFSKGNINGKPRDKIMDDSGYTSNIERGNVARGPTSPKEIAIDRNLSQLESCPTIIKVETQIKESMNNNNENYFEEKEESQDKISDETIDSIDFENGKNKLSIRFSKKQNRMYRIQIFINEEIEIRPVTYTGTSTGTAFWNLLKGSLKK